jgi:hypothetical protein
MATNITRIVPTINPADGQITGLLIGGDSDRARLRLVITSLTNNAAVPISALIAPDAATGLWSTTLTSVGDDLDFFPGDISCYHELRINVFWFLDGSNTQNPEDDFPVERMVDCSTCFVTADSLDGLVSGDPASMVRLTASGTLGNCEQLRVTISGGGGTAASMDATIAGGRWEAVFVHAQNGVDLKGYHCNESFTVRADCLDAGVGGCSAEESLTISCGVDCSPVTAEVEVTLPSSDRIRNPQAGDLQCVEAGEYIFRVVSPPANEVQSYRWFDNSDPTNTLGTAREFRRNVDQNANVIYCVEVLTLDGCSPQPIISFACGGPTKDDPDDKPPTGNGGEEDPNGGNGENGGGNGENGGGNGENGGGTCDCCCVWFIINIFAIFATLIAFVIAGCVFQWVEPVSLTTAISLAVATTISVIAWGIACNGRSGGSCQPILRTIDLLDALTLLASIVAILMGVSSPCAIAFWIDAAFLQWIRRLLQSIATLTGCLPNPWWAVGPLRRR